MIFFTVTGWGLALFFAITLDGRDKSLRAASRREADLVAEIQRLKAMAAYDSVRR